MQSAIFQVCVLRFAAFLTSFSHPLTTSCSFTFFWWVANVEKQWWRWEVLPPEGWWSWWVDKEDPVPSSKETASSFSLWWTQCFVFWHLCSVCTCLYWSVMERERSQRREGAATWLRMPKEKQRTTLTKNRVNRNMPQNRLGRTQKPDTNLLLCFKASSVHPPPSTLSGFPPLLPVMK